MSLFDLHRPFDAALRLLFKDKPEQLRFLLNHERKGVVISNLAMQVTLAEMNPRLKFSRRHFDYMVVETAKFWADLALTHKEQQLLTEAEKHRRESLVKTEEDILNELAEDGVIVESATKNEDPLGAAKDKGIKGSGPVQLADSRAAGA